MFRCSFCVFLILLLLYGAEQKTIKIFKRLDEAKRKLIKTTWVADDIFPRGPTISADIRTKKLFVLNGFILTKNGKIRNYWKLSDFLYFTNHNYQNFSTTPNSNQWHLDMKSSDPWHKAAILRPEKPLLELRSGKKETRTLPLATVIFFWESCSENSQFYLKSKI